MEIIHLVMKAFFGDSKRKPSKKKPKAQSKPKIFAITEESQNNTINDWKDNDDVIGVLCNYAAAHSTACIITAW